MLGSNPFVKRFLVRFKYEIQQNQPYLLDGEIGIFFINQMIHFTKTFIISKNIKVN